jgi:hypothetical protein
MSTYAFVKRSNLLSSLVLLASAVSLLSTRAEDGQVQGAMIVPVPTPQVASGAVEDSLKACLARFPEKADLTQCANGLPRFDRPWYRPTHGPLESPSGARPIPGRVSKGADHGSSGTKPEDGCPQCITTETGVHFT